MEWKTIDSAPKDGTEVLGCIEYFTSKAGHLMGGEVQFIKSVESKWNGVVWCRRSGDLFYPTHWCEILQLPMRNSSCSTRKTHIEERADEQKGHVMQESLPFFGAAF